MQDKDNENYESGFIEQFSTQSLTICSVGQQMSGKTHFHLQLLKLSLDYNLHNKYHLILPAYSNEQNDSYNKVFKKNDKRIKVYNKYHPIICNFINTDSDEHDTFVLIDDCTGEMEHIARDDAFKKMFTRIRHHGGNKLYIGLCMHYSKVIPPVIRSNATYFILYFLSNYKAIEDFYDENIRVLYETSLIGSNTNARNQFKSDFKRIVMDTKYGAMMFGKNGDGKYILVKNFNEWEILQYVKSNSSSVKLKFS